jgi:two-component system heavy metal sensor histidine kinase CusS
LKGGDLDASEAPALNQPATRWIAVNGVHARAADLRTRAIVDTDDWEEAHATPSAPPVIRVIAAQETTNIEAFLSRLRALLVAVGGLGALTVAGVLALVIRRSLRPLDDLARGIAGLSDDDLSSRVRVPVIPREMKPVVDQLNELLGRLEAAFLRERTFASDIAHELRTPLAGLRSTLEVTMSRARSESDYRETLEGLMVIVGRMQSMVETLLYLGRLDAGQVVIEERTVDSRDLLKTAWESLAERARTRRISLVWAVPDEFSVTADPILLEVAVRNLLDNAITYADDAGTIRIEAMADGEAWLVRVANSGSRIPQERVGELMRRFTRADPARPASGEHFGLGLALTSRVLAAMHTGMEITTEVGGEFAVSFRLRRAVAAG